MQYFHYNYIKNKYVDKTEMLLTVRDSIMPKTQNITIMQMPWLWAKWKMKYVAWIKKDKI